MKKHQVIATLALATIAATASTASALKIIPIPWQPPPNPNHFLPLDSTHDVVTTLTLPAVSSSTPIKCSSNFLPNIGWFSNCESTNLCAGGIPCAFSADFGAGSDISDAGGLAYKGSTITAVTFEWAKDATFEHLAGFYETAPSSVVIGTMPVGVGPEGTNHPVYAPGALVLALQTQDDAGNWTDVATTASPLLNGTSAWVSETLSVSAKIPNDTAVRMELRAGSAGGTGGFGAGQGVLYVPECVPDESNPGTCLP
jgi:hypothetical protein